jgi:hypothetical protein
MRALRQNGPSAGESPFVTWVSRPRERSRLADSFGSRLEIFAIHCAALRIRRLSPLYFLEHRASVRSSCFIAGYISER